MKKAPKALKPSKKIREALDQVDDILSSGYGDDLSSWHEEELTELAKSLNKAEKAELFQEYVRTLDPACCIEGELEVMSELFGNGRSVKLVIA